VTKCEAVGIGGDRLSLYSHPAELRDGGWTAEGIVDRWDAEFGPSQQPYGVRLPALDLS
jgi:3-oxoacyl-[acyl-carrier protein] reductase